MSKQLVSEIEIDATAEQVWEVLTDFAAYPAWNPFIVSAVGSAEVGSTVTLRMQPVDARAITLTPTVLEASPGHRLRWRGRLGVSRVFDAEHVFTLTTRDDGGVTLCQAEEFTGVLVPFMAGSLDRHTLPAFVTMNEALKVRAEQAMASRHG
jgi:hypothetical protein